MGVFPIKIHVGTAHSRDSGNTLSRINISAPRAFTCPASTGWLARAACQDNAADLIQACSLDFGTNRTVLISSGTADSDLRGFLRDETSREKREDDEARAANFHLMKSAEERM